MDYFFVVADAEVSRVYVFCQINWYRVINVHQYISPYLLTKEYPRNSSEQNKHDIDDEYVQFIVFIYNLPNIYDANQMKI